MADVRALPRRVLHELYTFGNQDQLFGHLLRWLLDKDGEHGLRSAMAHKLGSFLDDNDHPELGMALQSDMLPVSAELVTHGPTADVLIMLAGSPRLALVSIHTLVHEPHVITEYQAMEATPIVLGHPSGQEGEISLPLWNWIGDLRGLLPQVTAGPFGDFTRQLLDYDPSHPEAASSILDLNQDAQLGAPPIAPPPSPAPRAAPAPAPPAPTAPGWGDTGSGWGDPGGGGGDQPGDGDGLSNGWMGGGEDSGGGGGGLADGWMNG